jgi:predicted  nucleic acid-binding Zn ribbon protein
MYIQEISIAIKTDTDRAKLVESFEMLMSFYRSSGQIQGKIQSEYIAKNKLCSLPYTHDKNALNPIFNNFYVNRQIKKIENLCNSKFKFKTVGKTSKDYEGACTCKKSDFYVLITDFICIASPITCGTCEHHVPLYRLPKYYDYGYMPILSWESNYKAADTLQMNCEVGERWALNQMQSIKSQLSKQGLKICQKIEELTQISTYYFLFNYKKNDVEPALKKCLNCNESWHLKERLHRFYDFKCDNCRIISTTSCNS